MLVTVITPSNASIFPEYIIPALAPLVRDPEVSVRCMYAQSVVALADTAVRYLEMGQALRAHGAYSGGRKFGEAQEYDETHFEASLPVLFLLLILTPSHRFPMTHRCSSCRQLFKNT